MIRLLPWLLTIALAVYALVDCAQTPPPRVRALPKVVWLVLIVAFPLLGSLAWLVLGRARGTTVWRGRTDPSDRPRGPDDDPDFLRRL
ncbi:MAG TPA: PLD nuclease N-terminal domain-containing protein [Pedococcus sp.]|jgi:hypothetical protein|nr:PLD nuclease N-terminal domain-containing protein [Pedococcus sp.]